MLTRIICFVLFLSLAFGVVFAESFNMSLVGTWTSPGGDDFSHSSTGYRPLTVIGDRAFIAATDKIYAVDISDPSSPSLDTTFGSGTSLCTDGEFLIACDGYCLKRYEPDSTYPALIDSYCCPGIHIIGFSCAASQNTAGDTAVVITWSWGGVNGFRYLPEWDLYTITLGGDGFTYIGAYIDYPTVFRTRYYTYDDTFEGVYGIEWLIISVGDPYGPTSGVSFDTISWVGGVPHDPQGFWPWDIVGNDSLVYVSRSQGYIGCWKYEEPGSIYTISHISDWQMSEGWHWLYLLGDILYAGTAGGVFVFDMSDAANPDTLAYAFGPFGMYVCAQDSFVYSCNTGRLFIHKIDDMQIGEIEYERDYKYTLFPNPVSPNSICRLSAIVSSAKLYDLTGKMIAETDHTSTLKVPDECGLYFVRIKTNDGQEIIKKIVVM